MLRGRTRFGAGLLAGAALVAGVLGPVAPAQAAPGGGLLGDQTNAVSDGSNVSVVAVHLTGNGLRRTGGGSGGGGGTTVRVSVPVPCFWTNGGGAYTGQKFYDTYFENGRAANFGVFGLALPSNDEIAAHKDDDGTWYWVGQNFEAGQFTDEQMSKCDRQMQAANGSGYVFVPAGQAPPPPPPAIIPAEQLMLIARQNMAAPDPVMETSPGARSFVRLPTWFWVVDTPGDPADGFVELTVTATAGPVQATVTAAPGGLTVTVPDNGNSLCTPAQAHTAWSPGAAEAGACTLTTRKSSATQPGLRYRAGAVATYGLTWAGVEADGTAVGGDVPGDELVGDANFPLEVAEVQAVVQ